MSALVLGWNLYTIRALAFLRAPTIIVAGSRKIPRLAEFPLLQQWRVPVEDHTSAECVLLALSRLPKTVRPDSVYTQYEFSLLAAALVSRALDIPGPEVAVSCIFRDKVLQNSILREAGIAVADWRELEGDHDEMVEICDSLGYPIVIKPVSGAGAADTEMIDDHVTASRIVQRLMTARPGRRMMVETFVPGHERTIDGIIVDGNITFLGIEQYVRNILASRDGTGFGAMLEDPVRSRSLFERAETYTHKVLGILGLRTGSFHMEVFEGHSGEFTYGECAARIGGGYVPPAYKWKFGVDLPVEALRLHFLGPKDYTAPKVGRRASGVAWASLACPPGVIEYTPSTEEIRSLPGVVGGRVYARKGEQAEDLRVSSAMKAGHVLVEAPDEESVTARLKTICEYFTERCRLA